MPEIPISAWNVAYNNILYQIISDNQYGFRFRFHFFNCLRLKEFLPEYFLIDNIGLCHFCDRQGDMV